MISMTEEELRAFAISAAQLSFAGGFLGGVCFSLVVRIVVGVADAIQAWEERRMRIHQARMRQQHGPLLLPGFTRLGRVFARRALRARASAQGDLARACERQGSVRGQRA